MILSNLIFDIVLYGLMAVAVAVDALFPVTHGVATLVILGFLVFLTAEDAAHLIRRIGWGQESFASGIAVSLFGFAYYWWRNQSDTAATALHICLMLSALMVLIGVVAAGGAAWKERSARPVVGLLVTFIVACLLGAAGGLAVLFWTSAGALPVKLAVVAAALAVWRLAALRMQPLTPVEVGAEEAAAPRVLRPAGGTTLHRALPLVVLGALAAFIAR